MAYSEGKKVYGNLFVKGSIKTNRQDSQPSIDTTGDLTLNETSASNIIMSGSAGTGTVNLPTDVYLGWQVKITNNRTSNNVIIKSSTNTVYELNNSDYIILTSTSDNPSYTDWYVEGNSNQKIITFTSSNWSVQDPSDGYKYLYFPESVHKQGLDPEIDILEDVSAGQDGSSWDYVIIDNINVSNTGYVTLRVSESPDSSFKGKVIFSKRYYTTESYVAPT